MDWLKDTRTMLRDRPAWLSYNKISERSGINRRWIERFAQGYYADPRIGNVQALHNFLKRLQRSYGE